MPSDLNYKVRRQDWAILKQSDFTCACCKFNSTPSENVLSGYMQVINQHVYCAICASALQLQRPIRDLVNHGFIVMANDLSQADVSNLCREIGFIKLGDEERERRYSEEIYDRLLATEITHEDYPFLTEDTPQTCAEIANCLQVMPAINDMQYNAIFKDLRYVPSFSAFNHIFNYWLDNKS